MLPSCMIQNHKRWYYPPCLLCSQLCISIGNPKLTYTKSSSPKATMLEAPWGEDRDHRKQKVLKDTHLSAQFLQVRPKAHRWENLQVVPAAAFELPGGHRVEQRRTVPNKCCPNCELLDLWAKSMLLFLKPLSWEVFGCADLDNWMYPHLPARLKTRVQRYKSMGSLSLPHEKTPEVPQPKTYWSDNI